MKKGELIWAHGKGMDFFGVLKTGLIKMAQPQSRGTDVTLELIGPNDAFGLVGTVDGKGCPLAAIAAMRSTVILVPKENVMPFFEVVGSFKDSVLFRLSSRFKGFLRFNASVSGTRVEQKLAGTLVMLMDSFGDAEPGGGVHIRIQLTRQVIAEIAGTSTESAIRTFGAWQRKGWIQIQNKLIFVPDTKPILAILEQ